MTQGLRLKGPTRRWQGLWAALCSALGQCCHLTQRGWEDFTQAPRSHCVWFSTPRPPGRLICECVELQCTRRPNHRAVFCFSTGYTCPKSRVHSCCRLWVCFTFEKLHPPDKPEGTIVSAETRQRLKSHEMEFSFLLGTREHGIK